MFKKLFNKLIPKWRHKYYFVYIYEKKYGNGMQIQGADYDFPNILKPNDISDLYKQIQLEKLTNNLVILNIIKLESELYF